jgi:hypothetical protein
MSSSAARVDMIRCVGTALTIKAYVRKKNSAEANTLMHFISFSIQE